MNCIKNFIKPDITFDNGIIIRGKYTFPKIFTLEVNVFDVVVKQSENSSTQ